MHTHWKKLPAPILLLLFLTVFACTEQSGDRPVVGFADAFEDSTIEQAKEGFVAALKDAGYSEEKKTLKVIYRNAQGNIPTLTQIIRYFITQDVNLIATNPSIATITALQNTKEIPVFMMVSPTPELMKVSDASGNAPANLFGVGENLDYIDTSFSLIPKLIKPESGLLRIGLLYNQSEPQSVEAYERLAQLAGKLGVELIARPAAVDGIVERIADSQSESRAVSSPARGVGRSDAAASSGSTQSAAPAAANEAGSAKTGANPLDAGAQRQKALMQGYTGNSCDECGNFTMVRNGTCEKCDTCGATSGCS